MEEEEDKIADVARTDLESDTNSFRSILHGDGWCCLLNAVSHLC